MGARYLWRYYKKPSQVIKRIFITQQWQYRILRKANKCNVRFKQLLASKIHSSNLSESANLSSKVDDLAARSAKLEKDLAETIAFITNASSSADKPATGAKVSQVAGQDFTSVTNSPSDRTYYVVVCGIDKCRTNTIRPTRLKKDSDSVSSVLGVTPDPWTVTAWENSNHNHQDQDLFLSSFVVSFKF